MDFARLAPPPGNRLLVVGGSGGIGRRLVEVASGIGLRVAVMDLDASIRRHPPLSGATAIALDVKDSGSVAEAFATLDQTWDGIDHLVYLVGYALIPPRRLEETADADWADVLAGNLSGAQRVAKAALLRLRAAGGGSIVNVASSLGLAPLPGFGAYTAAKAGLIGLTKTLAVEAAPAIRVNAVAPTAIRTAFVGGGTGRGGDDDPAEWFQPEKYLSAMPLARLAEVDDVIGPILFLLGDGARFITGETMVISGGRYML